ncbi:MAG: LytR C-terminal domain-containing protein [Melioribacteraceae bacterium]|nr:LytR C-terminal domain-containing protein [Melioribacteraceae bacterium]
MEKNISKKTANKSVDLKTSTNNLFLNIAIFVLFALILFMLYSIYIKFSNSKNVESGITNEQIASDIIQVEVLNGCGVGGIADRFTDFLRNNKFDVVNVANYIRFDMDETLVIDRRGNKANAYSVAKSLGVKKENVIQQLNDDYFLDVSIVIGRDYFTLQPLK